MQGLLRASRSSLSLLQRSRTLHQLGCSKHFFSSRSELPGSFSSAPFETQSFRPLSSLAHKYSWSFFSKPNEDSEKQTPPNNNSNEQPKKDQNKQSDENPQSSFLYKIGIGLSVAYCTYTVYSIFAKSPTMTWIEFKDQVASSNVQLVTILSTGHQAKVELKSAVNGNQKYMLIIPKEHRFIEKLEGLQQDLQIHTLERIPVAHHEDSFLLEVFTTLLPYFAISLFLIPRMRPKGGKGAGGDIFAVGKSKHRVAQEKNLTSRFKDVAGLDEAKQEVMEFVEFLKRPEKFRKLGAKIPKGAMLVGPPGTGKTLLAKAIAGEAGVPFFAISGSDFLEMFVGVGPARVRDLFKQAKASAPCIIWIDEIDAVGRSRSNRKFGNDERENTLNQLLVEMDGFEGSTNVIVMAGTNRVDILDKALLRPGRFDRQISIDAPDLVGRKDIFNVHLGPIQCSDSISKPELAKKLAALTPSFTGADIANVCNEAALIAARHDKPSVDLLDFESAIERVIAGLERKSRVLSKEEVTRVAYHEAGHAIAGWFLPHASPLLKVSIIPRGVAALGYAQLQPRDQYLHSTEQLNDHICTLLAGRAAEELCFNSISTGARDDLEKVTSIIYGQLMKYGMSSVVGTIAFPDSESLSKSFSEKTARIIDQEARTIVKNAYASTISLLTEKRELLEAVAQHLLKHEVLRRDEMVTLVGPRPFAEVTTYEQMLGEGQ